MLSFGRLGSVIRLPSQKTRLAQWGFAAGDIVLWRPKIKRSVALSGVQAAQYPADDPGRIIHRRNHPCIVQPRRPDHAEDADDAARGIAIGRDDGGGTGQRKQLVFRSDENPHAFGMLGPAQQIDHAALGLEIVEQRLDPFEIFQRVEVFQQIGVAAHDQLPVLAFAARPAAVAPRIWDRQRPTPAQAAYSARQDFPMPILCPPS